METKVFLVSDTHFGHAKLIEWGRPPDFEDRLWKGLEVVQDLDVLIHLGDFCIGEDEKNHCGFMNRVKGTKIFVRGNHDHKSDSWLYRMGWDFVCDEYKNRHFGKSITFTHIPIPRNGTDHNVHGHTHGNMHRDKDVRDYYDKTFHVEVAPENTDYKPILLTQKILNPKSAAEEQRKIILPVEYLKAEKELQQKADRAVDNLPPKKPKA